MADSESKVIEPELIDPSRAARELSKLGAAKGGRARADKLTAAQRREIAKRGAEARWSGDVPKVSFGSPDRPLRIGNVEIEAYVLDDETRVLSQAGFLRALGRHPKANTRQEGGEEPIPVILQGKSINPFIPKDLIEKSRPIKFRLPNGVLASGYRAELLPQVCEIYLQARDADKLPHNQRHVAKAAEILVRGLANVGIIALVDEATGYQIVRARLALEEILDRFISDELGKWTKRFPDDFFTELFRLKGLQYIPFPKKRPRYVGHWVNNIVYERLAPGVLEELKRKTPKDSKGRHKHGLHQWLTDDVGDPKLREHLAAVTVLMRACDSDEEFQRKIDRSLPRYTRRKVRELKGQKSLFETEEAGTAIIR